MTHMPGYPCAVCGRESKGWAISAPDKKFDQFCSDTCARLFMTRSITPRESDAAEKGGQEAGAYLERIGKTDLASLSLDEWKSFCETLYRATCDELRRQADDEVPF